MDATHTKSLLYRTKYDFSSDPKDLEYSIAAAKAAVAISAKSRNLRMFALENLSSQLCRRAEAQRSSEDIDAAIVAARNALDVCSEERVQRAEAYANLGARLEMKYTLFGGSENLVAAIGHSRFAVTTLPENHRKRALHLHNLSNGLRLVFEDSGKAEVLDESIRVERNALKIAARDDPEKYIMLYGLSLSLEHRFRKTQNSQDMNEAMSAAEEALAGMPKGSTRYPMCLHNLANVLHDRFMRSKAICDIDRAVKAASDAISSGSSDETGELVYSMTLSASISVARGVIQKCSRSHPKRPHWLSELVLLLDRRFECSGSKEKHEYLDQALQFRKESVATLSEHHPDMAWFLCSLGSLQVKKNELLIDGANQRKPGFLLGAIASFRRGFNQANASPSSKICNGMLAGSCYMALGNWEPASEILSGSVQLLQQVSPLSLDDNDRQHQLRGLTGLSTEACVSYLMLGKVEAAAEILEAGRGIIANISTRQHEDHKALKSASLSLHTQYTELCQSLSLGSSAERDEGLDLVAKRNQDQASLERIEERIRRLPGLEHFNKRLSASQIRRLAERGPLVSYCTTESRAFALIVTTKSISSLPLPDLLWDDVERNTPLVTGDNRLSLRPPSKRSGANKKMRELLAWLWDTAVKPVLDHLGLIRSEGERLHPRLWWVTSGPLGVMPLHAAGKGSKFPQENTYAHVVSSYTATFSALAFARQCQSKVSRAQPKVALVTMPKTAARRDLNTAAEVQAVRDAFSTSGTGLVEMCQPAAADVLHQVRGGSIDVFHFSCHSEPDLNDPSKTSLLFGCDATATSPDRLPIQELRKFNGATDLSSRAPQLAYLSACCTAQQYDLKLLDENVHLAAVFQVMGFPSVIGTLWEADDIAAAFIAKAFYQELFQLRHVGEDNVVIVLREEIIARALYNTTAACRSAKFKRTLGVDDVLLWANFIHFRL
ncbi:CHAT domain-containing protein [Phyllosticta citribraziliensis]